MPEGRIVPASVPDGSPSNRRRLPMHHPFALTATLLFVAAPLLAQEKTTLRLKFVPGHVSRAQQSQDLTMSMAMGEQKMNTSLSLEMWTEMKVADVKDGTASIDHKYTRAKARSDSPGSKVDYDSDVPGSKAGAQFAAFGKLVGQTVTTRVDATCKLQEVKVPEDLDMDLERVGMDLKQQFEQMFTAFPKDPIAVGDSWTTESEMKMGQMGMMKSKVVNKLVELKDDVATIEQKIEMDTSTAKLPQGQKLTVPKAGGTSKVDLRTGLPVEQRQDIEMKMGDMMTMSIRSVTKQVDPSKAAQKP